MGRGRGPSRSDGRVRGYAGWPEGLGADVLKVWDGWMADPRPDIVPPGDKAMGGRADVVLRKMMARFAGRAAKSGDATPVMDGAIPALGGVYAFQTTPLSDFAAAETGRYASFKIIGINEAHLAIAVLAGVWGRPPSFGEVSRAPLLREHRFAHAGRVAAFGIQTTWWRPSELKSVSFVGGLDLSPEERAIGADIIAFAPGTRHSTLTAMNHAAEGEWRWANDRAQLVAEFEKRDADEAKKRAVQEERYRTRLSTLTWDLLLAEIPFERWTPSPPFPPIEFTEAARHAIHDACRALKALGPKPKKAQVRSILKACVDWFNRADAEAGRVIETEEREDICSALEEMAFVARQKALIEEIDAWREW